jgi:MFS family permease
MYASPVTTRRAAVLPLLCSAQFLLVLDVTIVAVTLPSVREALGFSPAGLQWVLSAYMLAFGGLLVAAGRAGDLFGRRRLFAIGMAVFGAASLSCGLATSAATLVAGRAVQGVGAALAAPAALALLTAAFPQPDERRHAVAWWTAAAAGGGASGWVLGGLLTESLGWQAVFLVNVPLCIVGVALIPLVLRESRAEVECAAGPLARLDIPGAITVTVGLALVVLGLTLVESRGAGDPWTAGSLLAGVAALAVFARIERRAPHPILPGWALHRPGFPPATVAAVALTGSTTSAMFLALLYQQEEMGRSALEVGLWCAPFNVAVIAGSFLGARRQPRRAMPAGLAAVAAGALALVTLSAAGFAIAFTVMGAGLGVASVASTASGTQALPDGDQGIASGVLNAAAQIGSALGLALVVTLVAPFGERAGFVAAAVIALATAVAVTRSWPRPRRRPTTPPR